MGLFDFFGSSSEVAKTPAPGPTVAAPQTSSSAVNPLNPNGVKPCCACPETKNARDQCFFNNSPEEAGDKCREFVEAHRQCMAGFGFKV